MILVTDKYPSTKLCQNSLLCDSRRGTPFKKESVTIIRSLKGCCIEMGDVEGRGVALKTFV